MGKPRMIILVRHAQSEGNKNRDIHQFIPDHRVKLTAHGWNQAEEAGRQLRSMLKPDDTLQFFTSPYRRTRETAEGILRTLTGDDPTPSPFPRHKIKVFEEPRLREQDFGNFQPCSAEMERMWQERADYGHFFYRIPHGESAADAYDRISGFNESLWRQFGDEDFPSVCVLVTHGLMTRVFLMKWYHWSVEYFEDLRNINHCEFIVMKQSQTGGKYMLQNELRTWSDLKRRAAAANAANGAPVAPSPSKSLSSSNVSASPTIPVRRWGGCADGCDHDKMNWPRRVMRKNTLEYTTPALPAPALPSGNLDGEKEDHPIASQEADHTPTINEPTPPRVTRKPSTKAVPIPSLPLTPASPNDASDDCSTSDEAVNTSEGEGATKAAPRTAAILGHLQPGPRSTRPGRPETLGEGFSDDSDYFPGMRHAHTLNHTHVSPAKSTNGGHRKSSLRATSKQRQESKGRERKAARKQSWMEESGMGTGARADTLGDGDGDGENTSDDPTFTKTESPTPMNADEKEKEKPILREALKGDMIVEQSEEERDNDKDPSKILSTGEKIGEADIEKMKEAERKGFGEVY